MHIKSAICKPNFTAWFVLQGTIASMHKPGIGTPEDMLSLQYYLPLAEAAAESRLLSSVIYKLPYAAQYAIGEFVTNKGRLLHYYLRKKHIAKWVRDSLSTADIKQLVILGAGLDVLSMQLASEFPDVQFIEIDVAESQQFKQAAFKRAGIPIAHNIEIIAGDLRDPLPSILKRSAKFSSNQKTLWLAEGLFMFLPESAVVRLLTEIKKICATGSQVVFTSLPVQDLGTRVSKWIQKLYLKREESSILWALPQENISTFVDNLGYIHRQSLTYSELHKSHNLQNSNDLKQVGEDMHRIDC